MIRPETASDTVDPSGNYSGFNYHNNNPGNRRYVSSNRQIQLQRVQINRPETASDTVGPFGNYSGFNYHNNNPGNRRYVNSNLTATTKGANDQTRDSLRHC